MLIETRNRKTEEFCNTLEDTLVIIVADHGIGYGATSEELYDTAALENGYMKDHLNPLLLVKCL